MKIISSEFIKTAKFPKDFPQTRKPEIAFLGRSNVGKSSLINALLCRKSLARTSSTPGRTRALNFFLINHRFLFVDLPGYGYAKVSQTERKEWEPMMRGYFKDHPDRIVPILILDARHGPTQLDIRMRDWLEFYGLPYMVVATKIDKVKKNLRNARRRDLGVIFDRKVPLFFFSATERTGRTEIWSHIGQSIDRLETLFQEAGEEG